MVGRAREIAPALAARAASCEAARLCPAESVADFRAAGLHRILQPARYGGLELGWDVHCEVAMALSAACAAQGWVLSIYNDHHQALGQFERAVQDEVWGDDPDVLTSAVFGPLGEARAADGGFVVSGRWAFASGIDHAEWLIAGCRIVGGSGNLFAVVPKSQATVIDDWNVVGLAGTGSKSFAIDNVFVPAHRTLGGAEADAGIARGGNDLPALYRMPRKATGGLGLAAVGVGAARGMIDAFAQHTRARMGRPGSAAGDQWTQLHVAESAADVRAAEMLLLNASRETAAILQHAPTVDIDQRIANKRDMGYAAMLARRTAERLFALAGGQSLYAGDPLQRYYRDIAAATSHLALRWDIAATPYGRAALGLAPPDGSY